MVVPARAGIFPRRSRRRPPRRSRPRTRGDLPDFQPVSPRSSTSSPHARGSSAARHASWRVCLVVPARAGLFRPARRAARREPGRPRTRGDLPDDAAHAADVETSSPHARGSSVPHRRPQAVDAVVPARAGIFPPYRTARGAPRCRPRTRGDLPVAGSIMPASHRSSPHARGSSHLGRGAGGGDGVVPARAGIFPDRARDRRAGCRRPRTRGDLPFSAAPNAANTASSPHARGSSQRQRELVSADHVVPARAGIFLPYGVTENAPTRRPRTRGDLPVVHALILDTGASSPHARGSSVGQPGRSGVPAVVPARAGIFRRRTRGAIAGRSRPRTRGDLPCTARAHDAGSLSSPHARGSSCLTSLWLVPIWVVPARAGIFPGSSGPRVAGRRRPRTRGDLPSSGPRGLSSISSSPHARGSSELLPAGRVPGDVVPARAGIFRRAAAGPAPELCRPRTRGDLPRGGTEDITLEMSSPHARGSSLLDGAEVTW